jgi:hypothetical protein
VLAKITVDTDGQITEIDPCECRRIVISFGAYALRCHTEKPDFKSIEPKKAKAGDPERDVILIGTHFKDKMEVYLGKGVKVNYQGATLTNQGGVDTYRFKVKVDERVPGGSRPIVLINPDCATATFADQFTVEAQPAPAHAMVQEEVSESVSTKRPARRRGAVRSRKQPASTKGRK